jgi:hypothetical protein
MTYPEIFCLIQSKLKNSFRPWPSSSITTVGSAEQQQMIAVFPTVYS